MNETHKNEPSVFGNLLRAAPGSENPMPLARYSEAIEKALVEEGVFNEAKNTDYWESAVRRHLLSSKPASTEWCEAAEKWTLWAAIDRYVRLFRENVSLDRAERTLFYKIAFDRITLAFDSKGRLGKITLSFTDIFAGILRSGKETDILFVKR